MINYPYSMVVLTYNRMNCIINHIDYFNNNLKYLVEFIIVDNCSDYFIDQLIEENINIKLIKNNKNLGAVGRNSGISVASSDIIITLDDDVIGITEFHLKKIKELFDSDDSIAAINFKIEEFGTGKIIDWCHPRDVNEYSNVEFETNDISEGAVALRKKALEKVGLYPESFFISHEGPDLAFRLINHGYKVIYSPEVKVIHSCDQKSRPSWRRYYFDTRNQLWFVVRNLSFVYGVKRLLLGWGSMCLYSLRDGFMWYWFKAIFDSFKGLPEAFRERKSPTVAARKRWKRIESLKPPFFILLRKRLKGRGIKI